MTYERRVVTRTDEDPAVVVPAGTAADQVVVPAGATRTNQVVERTDVSPSGGEMLRRVVILIFGIIQVFIILRIVLLLLNAREGNDLVSFILNTSQLFVAPFVGIFNNDALKAGGSVLDIAAIAALIGWSLLEVIVIWAVNLLRREPVGCTGPQSASTTGASPSGPRRSLPWRRSRPAPVSDPPWQAWSGATSSAPVRQRQLAPTLGGETVRRRSPAAILPTSRMTASIHFMPFEQARSVGEGLPAAPERQVADEPPAPVTTAGASPAASMASAAGALAAPAPTSGATSAA
jgi:hypothetical protein